MTAPGPDETLDEVLRGRLRVLQPRRGYRLSVDPLLLADFVLSQGPRVGRFCDLGAGVGVIGLALAAADPRATGTLVEVQPRLAALAARNVALAGAADRLTVVAADLRDLAGQVPPRSCDLVVSNPPYRPAGSGRPNLDPEKAIANLELHGGLGDLVAQARRLLRPRGRLAVVHDAARLGEVLAALAAAGLAAVALRLVHPRATAVATRLLVRARPSARRAPLTILPPLVLHEDDGRWTAEAARLLGEPGPAAGRLPAAPEPGA